MKTRRRLRAAAVAATALVLAAFGAEEARAAAAAGGAGVAGFVGSPLLGARPRACMSAGAPRPAATVGSTSRTAAAARGGREGEEEDELGGQPPTGEGASTPEGRRRGGKRDGKAKHFEFLKEVAQNKKQARANRQRFRDNRDKYLEEMRQAFKLMQLKEREESGFRWVKRPQRDRPPIPLHELALGSKHAGVVITVKEHGAYVDFGAKRDGFVRLRDFSDTDFVLDARDVVAPGDEVTFYVKYVSPKEGIVTGSFVPAEIESEEEQEARTPLSEVREDDELWGEVTKVSNYGAFVDVGVEVQGFLHIIYYPKRGPGSLTQDVFYPGQRLRVWAMEVDRERKRLKLTGERPRSLPRVDYSWFLGGEDVDPDPVGAEGRASYAGAGLQSWEDGRGLQPRGRGKRAFERMQAWELDGGGGGARRSRFEEEGKEAGESLDGIVYDLDAMNEKLREQEEE